MNEQKQKTILLVEDEALIAVIEREMLERHGFNVITASNGEKAIEIVRTTPDIDLILMDINLGRGMDGTEAAEIILKERDIPVLFLSSYTQPEIVEKTEKITSYGYVVKDSGETVVLASIKMAFKLCDAHDKSRNELTGRMIAESHRDQQLYFATALNEIAEVIITNDNSEDTLENANRIIGKTLQLDRALIYYVSFEKNYIVGLCEWLKADHPDIAPTKNEYPLDIFLSPFTEIKKTKKHLESHFNAVNEHFINDGSGKMLHEHFKIKSLIWYPFAFDEHGGYYVFTLDQILEQRVWTQEEIAFLGSAAKQVSLALMKIRLIEERKLTEKQYQSLFETSTNAILIRNRKDNITIVNNAALELLGASKADDLIGRAYLDFVHPEDRLLSAERVEKIFQLASGENNPPEHGDTAILPREHRMVKLNGQIIHVESTGVAFYHKGSLFIQGIFRNITDRKKAEEKLHSQAELVATLLNTIPSPIYYKDTSGVYLGCNYAFEKLWGISRDNIVGRTVHDMGPAEIVAKYETMDQELLDRTGEQTYEWKAKAADGSERELIFNKATFKDSSGCVAGVVGVMTDITERKQAEDALKESEEKFRLLFEKSVDPILMLDGDRFVDCNEAAVKIMHCTRKDQLIGTRPSDVSPDRQPDGRLSSEKEDELISIALKQGSNHFEWKHRTFDGEEFWADVSLTIIPIQGRRIMHVIWRDITDRIYAQQKIIESEQLLYGILSASPNGIGKIRDRVFEWVNDAMCHITGYTLDELRGASARILYESDEEYERTGEVLYREDMVDATFVTKDGAIRNVLIQLSPTTSYSYIFTFTDITERKHAEKEILQEREKLKTLSDNAPFGMALVDKDGHFTYINAKFTGLFGFDISDIPDGRTWFRKAYPNTEYRHTVISTWLEDFGDAGPGERKPRIFTVTCKDGTQKIVQLITSMLVSGDYLMTCENITQLKHLESQLTQSQKMEAIGTLAGGIAHDFNNILTALMGYATLMQMKMDKDSTLQSYVDQILLSSQKAADLTKSLLAFSRKQPVTLVPLDINSTIKATKKLLKRLLTEDIELLTSLIEDDMIVMADKSQMDQILFNLVANARDAMPKGGKLTIETSIGTIDRTFTRMHGFGEQGRYVQINISDTGMGMDEATKEKIFDPFFTTKEIGKGTGLGLATVYGIVKQHNGYITVDSTLNQGTTFRIYLPAVTVKVDKEQQKMAPAIARGTETILIAEDNEEVRHFMREALQRYGYKIIEASDGEDAVDTFKQHRDIDLIIVDSVMPKKNGREAYEEIHGINPHVKALFMSGYTKDIVLNKGIEDKEFDFIAKPLSLNAFLQKVREVLDRE